MKTVIINVLFCLSCSYTSQAQVIENEIPPLKKHELGSIIQYRAGRVTPGLQYYFGVKPGQQVGLSVNMLVSPWLSNATVFSPEFNLSYRWRWKLYQGLHVFVEPTLSYSLWTGQTFPNRHIWGVGANSGLEYIFDKGKVPVVLGLGMKSMVNYTAGRFNFNVSPNVSLRFRF